MPFIISCVSREPSGLTDKQEKKINDFWHKGVMSYRTHLIDLEEITDTGPRYEFKKAVIGDSLGGLCMIFHDIIEDVEYFSIMPKSIREGFRYLIEDMKR